MKRWLGRGLVVLALCAAAVLVWVAATLRVEQTAAGVPVRWLLPLSPNGTAAIAIPILVSPSSPTVVPGFLDGPVVEKAGASWRARWYCEDRMQQAQVTSTRLTIDCAGSAHEFDLAAANIPAAVQPMPARVHVLSDIEGDVRFLQSALLELGLVDSSGGWSGKDAQVVVLGDSVDRGRDVFDVLWTLRRLQREADAAGGAVHVVIGNHEQYVLRGIGKSLHPEHRLGVSRLGGQGAAFGANTVIGDWLRRLPVAVRLGDTLFVHGGLSPATAKALAGPEAANTELHRYWMDSPDPHPVAATPALDAVLGKTGLTQYRGVLRAESEVSGAASTQEIEAALAAWKARRMVIAHTVVEQVRALHEGRVWAVDLADPELPQAVLTFMHGVPEVVPLKSRRHGKGADWRVVRASLADSWGLLSATVRETRRAAAIPMPY